MEWISIEKELPKSINQYGESENVLIVSKIGEQTVCWYNHKLSEWIVAHHHSNSNPLSFDHVPTHWMPLPENPKK